MPSNSSHPAPNPGPDLAPLLEASLDHLDVHAQLRQVIEWSQPIPYAVVEWWSAEGEG